MANNLLHDFGSLIDAYFESYYQHGKIDIASIQAVIKEKNSIKQKLQSASISEQIIYIDNQRLKYDSDFSIRWYFNFGIKIFTEKILSKKLIDNSIPEPLMSEAKNAMSILLEMVKVGKIIIYLNHNTFGGSELSYSEITELLSGEVGIIDFARNVSSIMIPDPGVLWGFGDVNGTEDAILVHRSDDWSEIEIFVSLGQKPNKLNLYQLATDGELDDEVSLIREDAEMSW